MRKCRIQIRGRYRCSNARNIPRGSRLSPTLEPVPLLWLGSVNARTASETVQHRQIVLSPLRGELGLQAFGGDHLKGFDTKNTQKQVVSLPLIMFIDGFGLYRNTYRTLMGMYQVPLLQRTYTTSKRLPNHSWASRKQLQRCCRGTEIPDST